MTDQKIIEIARKIVSELFEHLDVDAEVKIEILSEDNKKLVRIEVTGDKDLGRLIGYHGRNLKALQMIIGMLINKQLDDKVAVLLDVNGYREKRASTLRVLARKTAEIVRASKKPYELPPMPAYERRIIHLALADDKDLTTESTGEGSARRVVIKPAKDLIS